MDASSETREEVLHVPSLFDYFCTRTAEDMRSRGGTSDGGAPAVSFASLIVVLLIGFVFWVFGRPQLAKASFVFLGALLLWTVWGAVVRSTEQVSQKADNIRAGVFPPASAPFVLARLKWWNHLIFPMRWGRHSRLFDRRTRLERKIEELDAEIPEALNWAGPDAKYTPPTDEEVASLAEGIQTYSERNEYENAIDGLPDKLSRIRASILLHRALLFKLDEMADKLDRIEKLAVVFHNVSPEDLSQVVSEAIQLLEERRLLVLSLDTVDPDEFIDLVSIRAS